ncbi:MAG: TetR/AcrR family transcriptional regulator C-terminal domain-containing protein [Chloroflexota bacterium]|nr:TetR/AcrR family transcriptional regulator C-terminal domain-containing protein [Chloroflexota bacterium]
MDSSTASQTTDRRERKTHAALEAALLDLLASKDYDAITVQEICDRADIARKTFYEHYVDKHALLAAYTERVFAALQASVGGLDADTLLADGKPLTYPVFKHVQDYARFYRAMLGSHSTSAFIMRLLDYAAQVSYERHAPLRAAAPRITVPPELIAHYLAGALLGSIHWWLKTDLQATAETMAYQFSQLAVPGILDALGLS